PGGSVRLISAHLSSLVPSRSHVMLRGWYVYCQQALRATLRPGGRKARHRLPTARPRLDVLEDRVVPSTLYSEAASGALSNNQACPTVAPAMTLGTNSVIGSVVGAGDRQDWITIHVPSGMALSSLVLASYTSSDAQGFMGVQRGTSFVGD